jgi:hypothetical protein
MKTAHGVRRTGPARVSGWHLESANEDRRVFLSNEGRRFDRSEFDSMAACVFCAVLFLAVIVTAPQWWPVLAEFLAMFDWRSL